MRPLETMSKEMLVKELEEFRDLKSWAIRGIVTGLVLIILMMGGCPAYKVYNKTMSGKAELMRQEQTRQIVIEQAKAEKEASKLRADAIAIVGKAAQQYPEYRLQEFMGAFAEALQSETINQIIYVPTEANIPLIRNTDQ